MASRLTEKTVGEVRIQGFSLAGEETVIVLPDLNVAFDIGRAPREAVHVDHICLSHGHMDHSAGIAYYFSQRNFQGINNGCALVHHKLVRPLEDLMQVWGRIEGHVSPFRFIGVDEGEDFTVHRGLVIRPFRVRHPGPTLGFSIIEVRKKLKPEYADLSGQQIVELKKQNIPVENRLEIPRVAYCADSALGNYLEHDFVRNAEVLLVECTFIDEDHLERARKGQHTHLRDFPELMGRVRSPNVVLFHLTRRTGIRESKRMLEQVLPKTDLERITVLMDRPRRSMRSESGQQE
ncbi:MAG: hypothetical protein GXY44_00280 [Phycisphaerales bacterium]|nr:hypothetical protein [Phycisphaerales bacterium]